MKTVKVSAFALAALCGASAGYATVAEPAPGFAGHYYFDVATGEMVSPRGTGVAVYDNTGSPANFAVSSTDLASTWGDQLAMTGTGVLEEFKFTVFNSATANTGNLLTATVAIRFYRAGDSSLIGGFNGNVNFGAGLNPGFYSTVTFTGLDGLGTPIALDTTDVIVTQQITTFTGTTVRLGVASQDPVIVGSSPESMYADSDTVGGGVAGFYTFGSGPANPGYQVVVPTPASAALLGLGGLVAARRRRA